MVNNSYGVNGISILEIANHLLVPDGKIMISGTLNNKYFNKLMKEKYKDKIRDLGFDVKMNKLDDKLKSQEFYQTNGKTKISTDKMMSFYAIKNKPTPILQKAEKWKTSLTKTK